MVFIAQNVAEDSPFVALADKAHGDTGNRFANLDTGIHQGQAARTDGGHGAGAVAFEDVGDNADGIGAFRLGGEHFLESAPGEVAVAYLSTAGAAAAFHFTSGKAGEVIMKEETAGVLDDGAVDNLLVKLGAQGAGTERLGFATGEDGAAMDGREIVDLAPEGADFVELTTIKTGALGQDHVAHGLTLGVVIVAVNHKLDFVGKGFLGIVGVDESLLDSLKAFFALVFVGNSLFGEVVALLINGIVETLTEFLVVDLVAVLAFLGFASLNGELGNDTALEFDSFVSGLEGVEHHILAHFLHLAFHHHDVVLGGSDDKVEVGAIDILHGGIDNILAVKIRHTHFGDGAVEGDIGHCESGSGSKSCKLVGHSVLVTGDEGYLHLDLGVEIVGEKGTEGAVDQAGNKDFVLGRTCLTFEKTARKATHSGILLLIIYGKGHEIDVLTYLLFGAYGGKKHGVVHSYYGSAVGLFGKFAGFDFDGAAVAKIESLCDNVHFSFIISLFPLRVAPCGTYIKHQ